MESSKDIDNLSEKSPILDRSVIEELNNLDTVTLRNLEDWNKKVGSSKSAPKLEEKKENEVEEEAEDENPHPPFWSPPSSENRDGATALSYHDLEERADPELSDEITDSDIETAGSEEALDDLTDYENSEMMEYQGYHGAISAGGDEEEERQCWVCFASQEDDPLAAWVAPCLCKGTTKWVHQVSEGRTFLVSKIDCVVLRSVSSAGWTRNRKVTARQVCRVHSAGQSTASSSRSRPPS